jgi:fibronectin-binding autotransporter adhesin
LTMGSITNAEFTVDAAGNTDIDGTLDVEGASTLQSTLGVTGATTLSSTLGVTDATTLSSTLAVTGATTLSSTLAVTDSTTLSSTLAVTGATTLSSTLNVTDDATFQNDVNVQDSVNVNTANSEGTVFTVYDSQGAPGVTIETVNTSGSTAATTLTTHRLIVQDDAVYSGDMNVNGALSVTSNITSASAPTSPNHMTNKQYVDDAVAAAITPPVMYDYDATNSTSNDLIYYINGDLLLYSTEEDALINYTISVYGENMDNVTGATLRARGNSNDLTDGATAWSNTDASTSTFNIGYTDIVALAGGQTDGYVSCSLSFTTAAGTYNSGLTIRFYLDSTNAAATGATFQD